MAKSSRFTIALIEGTRATSAEIWLSDDDGSRGAGRLVLRVSPTSRLFYFRYFLDGKKILLPLGPYAKTPATLEEAREVAISCTSATRAKGSVDLRAALLSKLAAATSPEGLPQVPAKVQTPAPRTVLELCNAYVDHLRNRGAQSARFSANLVRAHVQPTPWAEISATELTAEQAADMIRRVVQAGHMTTAKHLRQLLLAAYNLAKGAGKNPTTPSTFVEFRVIQNPVSETASMSGAIQARDRPVASKLELGHMWLDLTANKHDLTVAVRAVRLNFYLGGQRCLQLLRCKLADLNLENGELTLYDPKGRRLTPRKHVLPLTSGAKAEVNALRQMAIDLGNPYLIPGKGTGKPMTPGPMSKVINFLSRRLLKANKLSEPFCYANIRSTIETTMAALEISSDIRAQIQSHDLSGVQKKHYDQWLYLPQKLKALESWQKHLTEVADLARAANNAKSKDGNVRQ
jgi:integrase